MNTACLVPLAPYPDYSLAVRLVAGAWFFAVIPQHFTFPEFRKRGSHPYEFSEILAKDGLNLHTRTDLNPSATLRQSPRCD